MPIPEAFIDEMRTLWQRYNMPGEFTEFINSLMHPQARGIRANRLKINPSDLVNYVPEMLWRDYFSAGEPEAVPWCDDGYYISAEMAAGKLPAYHAGLFYIQEPSAMLPARVLAAKPGEKILDLCAAPGGKTTRIAADLGEKGLLWANEISADRARALLRNVELLGCKNCIISQETPERLADMLPEFFDRVLVDAPCSGSGMFRRDNQAASSWEKFGVEHCTLLQKDILDSAHQLLKPGGWLVYSTCSFSIAEDEAMIDRFVSLYPEYEIIKISGPGLTDGIEYDDNSQLSKTARIWPHMANGDGHFCALLRKLPVASTNDVSSSVVNSYLSTSVNLMTKTKTDVLESADAIQKWFSWAEPVLSAEGLAVMSKMFLEWIPRLHNNHLQLLPPATPSFAGLKMVKTGLYLGNYRQTGIKAKAGMKNGHNKKFRNEPGLIFEPAHSWFTSMKADDFAYTIRLDPGSELAARYLRGETISPDPSDYIVKSIRRPDSGDAIVVCLGDFPLGHARMQQGTLKNMYPPAWRLRA